MGQTYDSLSSCDEASPKRRGDEIIPAPANQCRLNKYHAMRYRNHYWALGGVAALVLIGKNMPFVPSINLPGLVEGFVILAMTTCCCIALCGYYQQDKIYRSMLDKTAERYNPFVMQQRRERHQKRHSSRRAKNIKASVTDRLMSDDDSSDSEDKPHYGPDETYVSIPTPARFGTQAQQAQPSSTQTDQTAPEKTAPVSQWMQFMQNNGGLSRVPGL